MIKAPETFGKQGYDYKLVKREKDILIYEQLHRKTNKIVGFEVHKVQLRNPDKYHDESYEKLASDEEFGTWGWSHYNYNTALDRLSSMVI